MYLIFDASANGKVRNWKSTVDDTFNWPRMIHLSWILLDKDLKPIEDYDCIIKPVGFHLTEDTARRAGLDLEECKTKGEDMKDVLTQFKESVINADYVFAHNLNFNEKVVGAEYIRANMMHKLHYGQNFCLMHEGTYYTKIPARGGGYKWPTLQELHSTIFKKGYSPANNARADVIAASRCFIALMKAGAFDDVLDDE